MKELAVEKYYDEKYDIEIDCYLTHGDVQAMAETALSYNDYVEREAAIDYELLCRVTNIGKDTIDNMDIIMAKKSGLIDAVRFRVENLNDVYEAIKYAESTTQMLKKIAEFMNKITQEDVDAVVKAVNEIGGSIHK